MKLYPKIFALFLITAMPYLSAAQGNLGLTLYGGMSMPTGEFESRAESLFGYATPGIASGLEVSYLITENLGAVVSVGYSIYGTDPEKLGEQYLQEHPNNSAIAINSSYFAALSVTAGLEYSIAIGENLSIKPQFTAGMANVASPEQEVQISGKSPHAGTMYAGRSNAFAYQGKLSFNYAISEKLAIGLFGSYSSATPTFHLPEGEGESFGFEQQISGIGTGLQLSFKL